MVSVLVSVSRPSVWNRSQNFDLGFGLTVLASVSISVSRVRFVALVLVHQRRQHAVPARRRRDLEEYDHAVEQRLEVEDVVDTVNVPHVHEERHAEYGVDEHDQEQQEADVDERRHGDGEREEQRSDTLGRLDQSQDATDPKHSHDPQQCRRDHVLAHVLV